jgi:hypothetical protein
MTMPLIHRELEMMLAQCEHRIRDARHRQAEGGRIAVRAAAELAFLNRQHDAIEARLADIDAHPETRESWLQWLREEGFNLRFQVGDLMVRR